MHLFPYPLLQWKIILGGQRFAIIEPEEVADDGARHFLCKLYIEVMGNRWEKFMELNGDYLEI